MSQHYVNGHIIVWNSANRSRNKKSHFKWSVTAILCANDTQLALLRRAVISLPFWAGLLHQDQLPRSPTPLVCFRCWFLKLTKPNQVSGRCSSRRGTLCRTNPTSDRSLPLSTAATRSSWCWALLMSVTAGDFTRWGNTGSRRLTTCATYHRSTLRPAVRHKDDHNIITQCFTTGSTYDRRKSMTTRRTNKDRPD